MESDYPIHFYKSSGFKTDNTNEIIEARAFITNKRMCAFLYEDLGIKPYRHDASKLISHIPNELYKYFILGLFDADGSFSSYQKDYGKKMIVCFGGSESLLRFIETFLIENNIVENYQQGRKLEQRHKDRDGTWLSLKFSGVPQGMRILNYLYNSPIYLDRKYEKYLKLPYHKN